MTLHHDPPTYVLRTATTADSEFLRLLFCDVHSPRFQLLPAAVASQLLGMMHEAQAKSYEQQFPNLIREIIETTDRRPIGRVDYTQAGTTAHVVDISLLAEFRHQGIGTDLFTNFQATHSEITLTVARDNPASTFYRRLNFVETGGDEINATLIWREESP